jgi:hypothetical protein
MNRLLSLLLLALLMSAGCARSETGSGVLAGVPAPTFPPPPAPAATVSIDELVAEPAAYAGQYIRLSGQYRRLPLPVCEGLPRLSPAGWQLAGGEEAIAAGGFDGLFRSLVVEGLTVTVEGRWLQWTGPFGCGKTAPVEALWYLAVQSVVEPQPLVRVTLTPPRGVAPTAVAGLPTVAPSPTTSGTALASPTGITAVTPGPATPTIRVPTVTAATTVTRLPTATGAAPLTATATISGTSPSGTLPPTITGTPPTVTATGQPRATGTPGTPQATATGTSGDIVDRGALTFRLQLGDPAAFSPIALEVDRLDAETAHRWRVQVEAGNVITASVAAQPDRDVVLQLRDPAGNVLVNANENGAGEVETIAGYVAPNAGDYQLIVQETSLNDGSYALLYLNSGFADYYRYEIAGVLSASGSAGADMPDNTDYLWLFMADAGDTVSITVSPNDASDVILNLLGPEQDLLYEYIDDAGSGQSELILNAALQDSGLYVLHVGEYQFARAAYSVTVSGN